MKKNILKVVILALCCILLSQSVFAVDFIQDLEKAIHIAEAQTVMDEIMSKPNNIKKTLDSFKIKISENTIMQVYYADLVEYAETGQFTITPHLMGNGQVYMSEVVDASNKFAGVIVFTIDGEFPDIQIYNPTRNVNESVGIEANTKRISALLNQESFDTTNCDAKMMWVDGLGYVYYFDNGTEQVLISAGLKGTNGDIFNEENKGIVVLDDKLKQQGLLLAERQKENDEYLSTLAPGENPITGGATSAFLADNSKYNSINHSWVFWGLAFLCSMVVVYFVVKKLRVKQN